MDLVGFHKPFPFCHSDDFCARNSPRNRRNAGEKPIYKWYQMIYTLQYVYRFFTQTAVGSGGSVGPGPVLIGRIFHHERKLSPHSHPAPQGEGHQPEISRPEPRHLPGAALPLREGHPGNAGWIFSCAAPISTGSPAIFCSGAPSTGRAPPSPSTRFPSRTRPARRMCCGAASCGAQQKTARQLAQHPSSICSRAGGTSR